MLYFIFEKADQSKRLPNIVPPFWALSSDTYSNLEVPHPSSRAVIKLEVF